MTTTRSALPPPRPKASTQAARRARRDEPVVVPAKSAAGAVQQIALKIPAAAPRAKKNSLWGALLGRRPKKLMPDRGPSSRALSAKDRARRVFIRAEAYELPPQPSMTSSKVPGEYMGSVLVGAASAAGMAHFAHAFNILDTLDVLLMDAGYKRKPKLTPSQTSVLRRMSEDNPTQPGMVPGVWITVGQAMDLDFPPAWYEDPDEPEMGRWVVPANTGKRRLEASNEQRYAQSRTLATNAPRPT